MCVRHIVKKNEHQARFIYFLGTDSGLKFKAPNLQSQPTQAIYEIKPNVPDHPAASFYNREQQHIPPMAEFKIELVHTKGRCSRNTGPKIGKFQGESCTNLLRGEFTLLLYGLVSQELHES
jgi:hypothetical protein